MKTTFTDWAVYATEAAAALFVLVSAFHGWLP